MLRPTDNSWTNNNNNNEKRHNNKDDDALHAWVTEPTNSWDDVGLGLPPRSSISIRRHNRSQRRARAGDTWVNWGKQAKPSQNGKSYEWSLLLGELKRNFIAKKEAKEAERKQEQHNNNNNNKRRSRKINENQVRMCIHNESVYVPHRVTRAPCGLCIVWWLVSEDAKLRDNFLVYQFKCKNVGGKLMTFYGKSYTRQWEREGRLNML